MRLGEGSNRSRPVTDAELSVLEELWRAGTATIRQLSDRLYPDRGASGYATVQKLLDRLAEKGCVERRRTARVHSFRPLLDRQELVARRLGETADRLCGGSLTPLLTHLVASAELSDDDLEALRQLVERRARSAASE